MANIDEVLDRNGVSHLYLLVKNRLTTYFKTLFVSKKDGYGLSQNDFTNELKAKLENMSINGGGGSIGGDGGVVIVDDEIIVVTPILNEQTGELTIDTATANIIKNYKGDKPMFGLMQGVILPYIGNYTFSTVLQGDIVYAVVDCNTLKCNITSSKIMTLNEGNQIPTEFIPRLSIEHLPDLGFYDDVVEGYFNSANNLFYTDANFKTAINGESGKLYIDLSEEPSSYYYNGSIFKQLESTGGGVTGLTPLTEEEIIAIISSVDGLN
jgi:hypothetical protein